MAVSHRLQDGDDDSGVGASQPVAGEHHLNGKSSHIWQALPPPRPCGKGHAHHIAPEAVFDVELAVEARAEAPGPRLSSGQGQDGEGGRVVERPEKKER